MFLITVQTKKESGLQGIMRVFRNTCLFLFLFGILPLCAIFVRCSPTDGQTPTKITVSPAQSSPFCNQKDISLPGDRGLFLQPLGQRGLLLDCRSYAPQTEADQVFLTKRAAIAGQYDELRTHFLKLREELRSLPENQALPLIQQLLPVALCRAAFPPWIGTTWDFYGASSIPGEGQIACGYFVAATLYAVGFNVKISLVQEKKRHYRLAGLPSEQIILKLVDNGSIHRFSNRPLSEVVETLKDMGPGVFLIGLDQHVAYLVWDGQGPVLAWHAKPGFAVALEDPANDPYIAESKYRVLGKLDQRSASIWLKKIKL